jgi:tetratricopeptide (TPR) repeat protein
MTRAEIEKLYSDLQARAPGSQEFLEHAQSVLRAAGDASYASIEAGTYYLIGTHWFYQNDLQQALEAFHNAVAVAVEANDGVMQIKGLRGVAGAALVASDPAQAKAAHDESLRVAQSFNDPRMIALAESGLVSWYSEHGLYDRALQLARSAYEVLRGTDDEPMVLSQIAQLLFSSENYEQALEQFGRVHALYERKAIVFGSYIALYYTGRCYSKLGQFEIAKSWYQKALDKANAHSEMARLEVLKELAEIEITLGNFYRASELVDEVYQYFASHGPDSALDDTLRVAATLEVRQQEPRKALARLEEYKMVRKRTGSPMRPEVHDLYADAYEQLGDWRQTAKHLREAHALREQTVSDSFRKRANGVQIALATEQEHLARQLEKIRADRAEGDLVNTAATLAAQTELLTHFGGELRTIIRQTKEPIDALKKVDEKLRDFSRVSIDWGKFERQFSNVHPEFRSKIVEKFPSLTNQEVKLCLLARLGMKTQDMARLLCISERTVDRHRNSLRKKLQLAPSENLSEYLHSI